MKRATKGSLCELLRTAGSFNFGDINRCEACSVMCIYVSEYKESYKFTALYDPRTESLIIVSMDIYEVIIKISKQGLAYYVDSDNSRVGDAARQRFIEIFNNMKSKWEVEE